jgi:hypothetical protein
MIGLFFIYILFDFNILFIPESFDSVTITLNLLEDVKFYIAFMKSSLSFFKFFIMILIGLESLANLMSTFSFIFLAYFSKVNPNDTSNFNFIFKRSSN